MSEQRDNEVFELVKSRLDDEENVENELVSELLAIAKKWRSKAGMRQTRIDSLLSEIC